MKRCGIKKALSLKCLNVFLQISFFQSALTCARKSFIFCAQDNKRLFFFGQQVILYDPFYALGINDGGEA